MALRINKELAQLLEAARSGETGIEFGDTVIPRLGGGLIKDPDDGSGSPSGRTRRFKLSDKSVDRDRDTIDPNGWDLNDFRRNGAVLWAHMGWEPPVAAPGPVDVRGADADAALYGEGTFLTEEEYDFSALLLRLIDAGALKNTSVGFSAIEWVYNEERRGIDFMRQKLVEWSIVPIGSNVNAMVQLSKDCDLTPLIKWGQRWLDGDEAVAKAVADEDEVRTICKALAPFAAVIDPGRMPSEKEPDDVGDCTPDDLGAGTDAGDHGSSKGRAPVLDVATLDQLIAQAGEVENRDQAAQIIKSLTEVREALNPEIFEMTRSQLQDFAKEAVKEALEDQEGDAPSHEDIVRIAKEELARSNEEFTRRTGRLPR